MCSGITMGTESNFGHSRCTTWLVVGVIFEHMETWARYFFVMIRHWMCTRQRAVCCQNKVSAGFRSASSICILQWFIAHCIRPHTGWTGKDTILHSFYRPSIMIPTKVREEDMCTWWMWDQLFMQKDENLASGQKCNRYSWNYCTRFTFHMGTALSCCLLFVAVGNFLVRSTSWLPRVNEVIC